MTLKKKEIPENLKKALYISGGFEDSQLLWVIIIASSFCKLKGIKILLFDKLPSSKIIEHSVIKEIFSDFQIVLTKDYLPLYYSSKHLRLLRFINKVIFYAFFINQKNLIKKRSWKQYQILHAIWDLASLNSKKNKINSSILDKAKASLEVMTKYNFTNILCKNFKLTSFLGHSVYQSRGILASLRENGCEVFVHSNYCLARQDRDMDIGWNMPSESLMNKIKLNIKKEDVEKYWNLRIEGKGNYEDAVLAAKGKNTHNLNLDGYKNLIMLHVFKDSPFNTIDQSRIFADYFDWIKNTVKIIKNSNEKWIIRTHPNAIGWGENQIVLVKKLIGRSSKNIIIEENNISNLNLYKKIKRIVTYSGTSHIEAGILGIKPIVISEVISNKYIDGAVFKPKTIKEYKKLLLTSSSSEIFKLNSNYRYSMKEILFIQENILTIKDSINAISIYRGSSGEILNKNFNSISDNLIKNKNYLELVGNQIANKISHSVSKSFINNI